MFDFSASQLELEQEEKEEQQQQEQKTDDTTFLVEQCNHYRQLNQQMQQHQLSSLGSQQFDDPYYSLPIDINLSNFISTSSSTTNFNNSITSKNSNEQLKSTLGYQLRAFSGNNQINAFDADNWTQTVQVPSLSTELVNETLNYFVNCRQRLNQMTKTYDDNDAYILLLQEKEVDLELAARIGQELLKQNKQLKESIKKLESELSKRQDDVQQLKHELATKTSLLNTYIEEEEEDEQQNEPQSTGENQKNNSISSKLEEHVTFQLVESNKRLCELQDELLYKGEQSLVQQEKIFRLEQQLRDSDRRSDDIASENESLRKSILQSAEAQQELYDELKICKRNFSELLSVFLELQKESRINRNMQQYNPNLNDFFGEFDPIDNGNISFDSFTGSIPPPFEAHNSTTFSNCFNLHSSSDFHEQQQQQLQQQQAETSSSLEHHSSRHNHEQRSNHESNRLMSSSLHEELQESLKHNLSLHEDDGHQLNEDYDVDHERHQLHHDSDSGGSDGTDSGLHTTNVSTTTSPSNNCLCTDTDDNEEISLNNISRYLINDDDEDDFENCHSRNKKHWMGFSSFMVTTLVVLCISATIYPSANSNIAQRLQIKLGR